MRTMRLPRPAGPAVPVSIVALAVAAVAELWLARRGGAAFVVAALIAAIAVVSTAALLLVRPKPAAATGLAAGAAGERVSATGSGDSEADLAGRRQAIARGLAETVDADLAALIVEAVAVQQALVRDAHPEDVLVRMQAVEESARTASADLRRLLSVAALIDPDHAVDPAASPAG
jgi:hypothetical protein